MSKLTDKLRKNADKLGLSKEALRWFDPVGRGIGALGRLAMPLGAELRALVKDEADAKQRMVGLPPDAPFRRLRTARDILGMPQNRASWIAKEKARGEVPGIPMIPMGMGMALHKAPGPAVRLGAELRDLLNSLRSQVPEDAQLH